MSSRFSSMSPVLLPSPPREGWGEGVGTQNQAATTPARIADTLPTLVGKNTNSSSSNAYDTLFGTLVHQPPSPSNPRHIVKPTYVISPPRSDAKIVSAAFSLLVGLLLSAFPPLVVSTARADSAKLNFNGHSYQRFDTAMSWAAAKAFCETKGGHLATITSQAENDFISANLRTDNYWLGGTDEAFEGVWRWITGEPWTYTSWDVGKPNHIVANENYIVANQTTSKWSDIRDIFNFLPMCEWDSYGATQSAGDQFSPTLNPNGTWSYGYKLASPSLFQAVDTGSAIARGIAGMYGWNASTLASEPHIYFNSTASAIGFANTVSVPARSIQMHPGPNGVFAVLRWTAPSTSTYAITGAFRGNDSGGGDGRIASIKKNGVEIFNAAVGGLGQLNSFNISTALSAGDTLDFMVDPNGAHQNDSTGLTLAISNVDALPLTLGLVGYWNFNDCTANDSSGLSNSGALVGSPTCVAGASGSGMRFNSTNYAEIPDSSSLDLTGTFTIST